MSGKKRGPLTYLVRIATYFLSVMYGLVVWLRNLFFDWGWIKQTELPIPVISIGNITVGGTGKTPLAYLLANYLSKTAQVAILSRGYKSKCESLDHPTVLSRGQGPEFSAAYCGDEPVLLASALPQAFVIVGKNRRQSAKCAIDMKAEVILLEDGLQHRYLKRNYDIVVIDAQNPFGYGHFLPHGLLRDSKKSLRRAHMIVLNGAKNRSEFLAIKNLLAPYSSAFVVGAQTESATICDLLNIPLNVQKKQKVAIFCAIANPHRFQEKIAEMGLDVVSTLFFDDHAVFDETALKNFATQAKAKGADLLLCTEKDKVKLDTHFTLALPIGWLKINLHIVYDSAIWDQWIDTLARHLRGG